MADISIDKKDLKVKHASGQYVNLPSAPEPDDILYYAMVKKKKVISRKDMTAFFGEDKIKIMESSLGVLEYDGLIRKTEDEDKYEIK